MKKQDLFLLLMSVVGFFLMAISFLLMPLHSDSSDSNVFAGILFWCSLLIGIFSQVILSLRINRVKTNSKRRAGLVMFFQNPYAKVCDVTFIISFVTFIITMSVTKGLHYSCYIFLAMTVFFFSMHCILNGRNYYYILNRKTVRNVSNRVILVEEKKESEGNED